jgi:hypothetical protein
MNKDFFSKCNEHIIESVKSFKYNNEDNLDIKNLIFDFLNLKNKKEVFGNFGSNLENFLLHADLNHTEILGFLKQRIFTEDCIREINELFALYKYCKRKKLNQSMSNLHKLCNYFTSEKMFLVGKTIDNLKVTKVHTRFLSENLRWEVRSCKKPTKIQGLKKSFEADDEPEEKLFVCYHHNSTEVANVLRDLYTKQSMFTKMDCHHLAGEIGLAIKKIENDLQSQSLGFHRITLNSAARSIRKLVKISDEDEIKIYPVDPIWCDTNNSVNMLVKICENFPAYNCNFACFDHYGVIKANKTPVGIVVGERDTQTFFIGYYHE